MPSAAAPAPTLTSVPLFHHRIFAMCLYIAFIALFLHLYIKTKRKYFLIFALLQILLLIAYIYTFFLIRPDLL